MIDLNDVNPHFEGTEEWYAWESGKRDTQARIDKGLVHGECNEDHLVMIGQAYVAAVRAARAKTS